MADNTITVIGNITRDPELRWTPGGTAQITFGLACNRRRQNRQTQEWEESTSFFDIVCWGSLAENAGESLSRGNRIIVTGRLEQRSWEGQDGEKRSKIEIIADEVGPSLRWATAHPEKSERRGQQGGGQGGGRSGGGGYSGSDDRQSNGYDDRGRDDRAHDDRGGRSGYGSQSRPEPAGAPSGSNYAEEEPF